MSPVVMMTGAVITGNAIAALFFLKFWRRTGDRLFLAFAAAFLLMGLVPLLTAVRDVPREEQSAFYLIRLAAFLIIIWAIAAKSRDSSTH
ncbi:DUF5985 family protein [Brevundimonas sp.]|uniref:DUF5985 family protein n=1 Tax=Brevundimonas sp. TaxID=1871086 RepID=UPI002BDD4F60|nr:DUF5985 family protein [Brevundimonas sp.]HWQ85348.1 DUF5985 family protein [Brevundimonas sp.]